MNRTRLAVVAILGVGLASTLLLDASPFRFPNRIVSDRGLNLKPLFTWWTNAELIINQNNGLPTDKKLAMPPRPFPPWVRIQGDAFVQSGYDWILFADVEDVPGHVEKIKILLRHPPINDREKFLQLTARINQFQKTGAAASSAAEDASAQSQAHEERRELLNEAHDANVSSVGVSSQADAHYAQSVQLMQNAARQRAIAENANLNAAQIGQLLSEYSPSNNGEYKIDLFAFRTGITEGGLSVFDLGMMRP